MFRDVIGIASIMYVWVCVCVYVCMALYAVVLLVFASAHALARVAVE